MSTHRDPSEHALPPVRRARRAAVLQRLLDIAQDASSYLRRHPDRAVRVSAALLLAASLAACSDEEAAEVPLEEELTPASVDPLAQETRTGLPTSPGRYPVVRESLVRDSQGVYHFAWREPGAPQGKQQFASSSLLRLAQAGADELEIPAQGDPVLYLSGNDPIALVASTGQLAAPTPQSGQSPTYVRSYWYPFVVGGSYREPAYYDPPRTIPASGRVDGGVKSPAPQPLSQRTVGLPHSVSGRAGGTGSGTAASFKSGAGVSASGGGATSAKSSGFSAGKGGASSAASSS